MTAKFTAKVKDFAKAVVIAKFDEIGSMSVSKNRKKLHAYIADLDEKKVKEMLSLLEEDAVEYQTKNTLTEKEKKEILLREQNRVSGKSKTYTLSQAKRMLRKKG